MKFRALAILLILFSCMSMEARKRPVIGITCGGNSDVSAIENSYVEAVARAGGIPVLIPCIDRNPVLEELVKELDGIIFTGGEDCNPALYGEAPIPELGAVNNFRDTSDLRIARLVIGTKKPIMAICRGSQFLNVAFGGTLYQDLPSQKGVRHGQSPPVSKPFHGLKIEKDSYLYEILGLESTDVNSTHHQAVKQIGNGLRVIAMSTDGVVEAYQNVGKGQVVLGMQFHPEWLLPADEKWLPIFEWFVEQARKNR